MSSFDRLVSTFLPPRLATAIARRLLKSTGVGHGGIVAKSGEIEAARTALILAGASTTSPLLFDVGGNVGEWTLAARTTWPKARVHVFEPSARHLEELARTVGKLAAVTVNPLALGAEAGSATLYKDTAITGLASMTRRDLAHVGLSMDLSETIKVTTLDEYCLAHGISAIDLLKIDVEGHELDVLKGGTRLFQTRAVAAVQFEFGGCNVDTRSFFRDFYRFFETHGYLIHIIRPGGKLSAVARYSEFNEQFMTTNYIAVRAKG